MPYGKKFLDTLDGILFEQAGAPAGVAHATSKRVIQSCKKCEGKISGSDELYSQGLSGTCKSCQDAELLKLKEDRTFFIPDLFGRDD